MAPKSKKRKKDVKNSNKDFKKNEIMDKKKQEKIAQIKLEKFIFGFFSLIAIVMFGVWLIDSEKIGLPKILSGGTVMDSLHIFGIACFLMPIALFVNSVLEYKMALGILDDKSKLCDKLQLGLIFIPLFFVYGSVANIALHFHINLFDLRIDRKQYYGDIELIFIIWFARIFITYLFIRWLSFFYCYFKVKYYDKSNKGINVKAVCIDRYTRRQGRTSKRRCIFEFVLNGKKMTIDIGEINSPIEVFVGQKSEIVVDKKGNFVYFAGKDGIEQIVATAKTNIIIQGIMLSILCLFVAR